MKKIKCIVLIATYFFASCNKNAISTPEDTASSNISTSVEYIPIAVVTDESSERICRLLNEKNIVCFIAGSVGYALYVREDQAEVAFNLLKKSKDWDVSVWSNGEYKGKTKANGEAENP